MNQPFDIIVLAHAAAKATVFRQLAKEGASCPSVSVMPYWRFVSQLYEPEQIVLDGKQATALWRLAVESVSLDPPILSPLAAANAAMRAHELLLRENISDATLQQYADPNTGVFLQWRAVYQELEQERGVISSASLERLCIEHMPSTFNKRVGYFGFDHMPAQAKTLFHRLEAQSLPLTSLCQQPKLAEYESPEAEIAACVTFCEQLFDQDDSGSIAVVAATETERYQRLLKRALVAKGIPAHGLMRTFGEVPEIACLLAWAQVLSGKVALDVLESAVFRPFVTLPDKVEDALRQWLAKCRISGARNVDLKHISHQTQGLFDEMLAEWRGPVGKTPAQWSESLLKWAARLGMELDRVDRPLYQWMTQISQLALIYGDMTSDRYVLLLQQEANGPISPPLTGAGIHFLSLAELLGGSFDAIWILGAVTGAWPATVQRNPFIPAALARDKGLPRSSAERELAYAKWQKSLILSMAPEVVASYPKNIDLETQLPSPLALDWQGGSSEADQRRQTAARQVDDAELLGKWEVLEDDRVTPPEAGQHSGGTALFTDMAQCPFRAFLRHRVGLQEPDKQMWGVDAKRRGIWYHAILEKFWAKVGNHARLTTLSLTDRQHLLEKLAQETWPSVMADIDLKKNILPALKAVEVALAVDILDALLIEDLARTPFEVEAVETSRTIQVGQFRFRIKLDRIDRMTSGERIVIDYKTGEKPLTHLRPEGLKEPQLPVYAVFSATQIDAVAFAVVNLKSSRYVGLRDEAVRFYAHGKEPLQALPYRRSGFDQNDWPDLLDAWRRRLFQLTKQYEAGDCRVAGKVTDLCQYCQFQPVCRRDILEPLPEDVVLREEIIASEGDA